MPVPVPEHRGFVVKADPEPRLELLGDESKAYILSPDSTAASGKSYAVSGTVIAEGGFGIILPAKGLHGTSTEERELKALRCSKPTPETPAKRNTLITCMVTGAFGKAGTTTYIIKKSKQAQMRDAQGLTGCDREFKAMMMMEERWAVLGGEWCVPQE